MLGSVPRDILPTLLKYLNQPYHKEITNALVNDGIISYEEYNKHWYKCLEELCGSEMLMNIEFDYLDGVMEIDYGWIFCISSILYRNGCIFREEQNEYLNKCINNSINLGLELYSCSECKDKMLKLDLHNDLKKLTCVEYNAMISVLHIMYNNLINTSPLFVNKAIHYGMDILMKECLESISTCSTNETMKLMTRMAFVAHRTQDPVEKWGKGEMCGQKVISNLLLKRTFDMMPSLIEERIKSPDITIDTEFVTEFVKKFFFSKSFINSLLSNINMGEYDSSTSLCTLI